jgi:hypothetical protein
METMKAKRESKRYRNFVPGDLPLLKVEQAIAWAAQQTYVNAMDAAREYGAAYGREMFLDQAYYNSWYWRNAGEQVKSSDGYVRPPFDPMA